MKDDVNKLLVKKTTEKVSIINSRGNFKFIHGPRILSVFHFGLPMEPYTFFDLSFNSFMIRAKFLPVSTSG